MAKDENGVDLEVDKWIQDEQRKSQVVRDRAEAAAQEIRARREQERQRGNENR